MAKATEPVVVELKFELTPEQVKKIRKDWGLSKKEFDGCIEELKGFVAKDPTTFLENLDWFNF